MGGSIRQSHHNPHCHNAHKAFGDPHNSTANDTYIDINTNINID